MLYRRITNCGNFDLTSICQFPEISNIHSNLFLSHEYIMNSGIAEVMGYFPFKPEFSSGLTQAFSFRNCSTFAQATVMIFNVFKSFIRNSNI